MNTPVLFLIFNRPDTTKEVFKKIREIQPSRLYVAADGPRKDRPDEGQKCEQVRQIATDVDWNCAVKTLFRDENMGCKYAVSGAIDWFFENEEMGIILEDDCLPSKSFFRFCEELLQKYKSDSRIMHINGNNYGAENSEFTKSSYSYHFESMPQPWGWATWRRAWNKYDLQLVNYHKEELYDLPYWDCFFQNETYKKKQFRKWDQAKHNRIDTWDYAWQYAVILNYGLCVVPKNNQITNIGFGSDATHTKKMSKQAKLETEEINFSLNHPDFVIPDKLLDHWYQQNMLGGGSLLNKIKIYITSLIFR